MPTSCAAINCTRRAGAQSTQESVTFHRFPKDPVKRLSWVRRMRRVTIDGKLWEPTENDRLCSCHFRPEMFDRTGQTVRLRNGAEPTEFYFSGYLLIEKVDEPRLAYTVNNLEPASTQLLDIATSSRYCHPRKLPNIPRNPTIYEPSPGIFKRKDCKLATAMVADDVGLDVSNENAGHSHDDKSNAYSVIKTENEEMSVELECYDEATPNSLIFELKTSNEQAENIKVISSKYAINSSACNTSNSACAVAGSEIVSSSNNGNRLTGNSAYRPPKLDDHKGRQGIPLPLMSSVAEIEPCLPSDTDSFDTLKSKLNRSMQLYTLQRRQLIKLSACVKNLARTNDRLKERAHRWGCNVNGARSGAGPCLATDTKYIVLFENLIQPEAMNTISTAIATSQNP